MKDFETELQLNRKGGTLLLFGGALGDFLCLLPGLFSLHRRRRGRIAVVAQPAFLELIEREDIGALSVDRHEVSDLFANGPIRDSTRNLFHDFARVHSWIGHGDDNFAGRLAKVSGGEVEIHRLRGMQTGEHAAEYLARCLGVDAMPVSLVPPDAAIDWATQFWRRSNLSDRTLIVHPGSGSVTKNWQGMAAIARRWQTQCSGSVLVLCGPAERSADVPYDALAREASLQRVTALLRMGASYLGNDSGISHLAGLSGATGVVTFGPSDAEIWHPLGNGLRTCTRSSTCDSCGPHRFCTHALGIDEVWEALSRECSVQPTRIEPAASQTGHKQR